MTGNAYGAIGAPQRQYHGETGLGMEEAARRRPARLCMWRSHCEAPTHPL